MYCRGCYYDLRGQEMARCPECGTTFDFEDADTFVNCPPRGVGRLWYWLRPHRPKLIVLVSAVWCITVFLVAPRIAPARWRHSVAILSTVNLKGVLTCWIIQQYDDPHRRAFDQKAAARHMRPSLSPWTEEPKARRRQCFHYVLTIAPYYLVPTIVYALLMIPLLGRVGRRIAVTAAVCSVLVLLLSAEQLRVADFLFPGSHAFISDYKYIPDVDLTSSAVGRGKTIAAYDSRSFTGTRRRTIGFVDGHVESLWDDRARPLFEAQGLVYPSDDANSEKGD